MEKMEKMVRMGRSTAARTPLFYTTSIPDSLFISQSSYCTVQLYPYQPPYPTDTLPRSHGKENHHDLIVKGQSRDNTMSFCRQLNHSSHHTAWCYTKKKVLKSSSGLLQLMLLLFATLSLFLLIFFTATLRYGNTGKPFLRWYFLLLVIGVCRSLLRFLDFLRV